MNTGVWVRSVLMSAGITVLMTACGGPAASPHVATSTTAPVAAGAQVLEPVTAASAAQPSDALSAVTASRLFTWADFKVQDIETTEPWDSVVAADLNGDGITDLIGTAACSPDVHAVPGCRDTAQLADSIVFHEPAADPRDGVAHVGASRMADDHVRPLSVVDMNADGRLDIVYVVDRPTRLRVLTSDANGRLGDLQEVTDMPEITGMVAADLDGDGDGDIACGIGGKWTATLQWIESQAGRLGSERREVSMDLPIGNLSTKPRSLRVSAPHPDGSRDLLGVEGQASLAFSFSRQPTGAYDGAWTDLKYGFQEAMLQKDIDGDGHADRVFIPWGSASFAVASGVPGAPLAFVDGHGWLGSVESSSFAVEALDVDGDGRLEIVLPAYDTDTLTVVFLDESFGLRRILDVPVCEHPWAVAVGDIDGDGREEIAVTSFDTNHISIVRPPRP